MPQSRGCVQVVLKSVLPARGSGFKFSQQLRGQFTLFPLCLCKMGGNGLAGLINPLDCFFRFFKPFRAVVKRAAVMLGEQKKTQNFRKIAGENISYGDEIIE